ncbi:recombinase family protein [Methylomagnum ishizawai]|uniref:recombinase family protein n=1 Tax=Methylomagnum ishizawai TaxID=1760988 RepID=UPI001C33410B|nr:recombinase family protein [Methylomagnum ishizawai]BBL77436.1 hypothetical protein MishRS11D_45340 [Methylomagnum ishizawai]
MKAYAYIRVSTEEQATDGVSLDAQKAKVAAWADLNGYELAGVFMDAGISGTKADRPGLAAALSAVGKGDALVVYSLSRLSRSTKHTIEISERLDKAGADLVSISEKIDTTTAMQHKKAKGERVGAVPYGKALAGDGVALVDVPAEQEIIAEARRLHTAGLSLRKIAAVLAEKGFKARNGKVFAATQIQRMVA